MADTYMADNIIDSEVIIPERGADSVVNADTIVLHALCSDVDSSALRVNLSLFDRFKQSEPEAQLRDQSLYEVMALILNQGKPFATPDKEIAPYFCGELKTAPWVGNTKKRKDKARQKNPSVPLEGVQRSKNHLVGSSIIKLDLDDVPQELFDETIQELKDSGLMFVCYSTFKHGCDEGLVRARIILFLDRQATVEEFQAASAQFCLMLQGKSYDKTENSPWQLAGCWAAHPSRVNKAFSMRHDGTLLSLEKLLALCPQEEPKTLQGNILTSGHGPDAVTRNLAGYDEPFHISENKEAIRGALYAMDPGHEPDWWHTLKCLKGSLELPEATQEEKGWLYDLVMAWSANAPQFEDEDQQRSKMAASQSMHPRNLFSYATRAYSWKNPGNDARIARNEEAITAVAQWSAEELLRAVAKDDIAHGRLFAKAARQRNIRFAPRGAYQYKEPKWVPDEAAPIEFAKEIVKALKQWAGGIKDEEQRKNVLAHGIYLSGAQGFQRMIQMAKTDPQVLMTDMAAFDADPMIFQVANGVIDLATGQLHPNSPDWMTTKSSPVEFDAGATCPKWTKFLSETFPNDPDTLESFQRWCGYSMTGTVREEVVCFFLGKGSNGKSTINRVFAHIFGNYRAQVPAGLLLAGAKDDPKAPNPALAMTIGARMLAVNEVQKHARLDDHAVRQVGGTEPITTRNLHEKPITFLPSGKLTVSLNDMPRAADMGQGLWRRVRIIPFVTHIPDTKQNHNLVHELTSEAPGILNWLIAGCRKWKTNGLIWSSSCEEAAAVYQKDTDTLGEFMTRYEVTGNDCDRVKQSDVWKEYSQTMVPMGETRVGKKLFYQMVGERHGIGRKHSGGTDWFTGIRSV